MTKFCLFYILSVLRFRWLVEMTSGASVTPQNDTQREERRVRQSKASRALDTTRRLMEG